MDDFEEFLDTGGVVEPNDAMPEPYRQAVFRFIELHANSEYMGGLTERDWIPKAPGLHRKLTALAKTQDEDRTCSPALHGCRRSWDKDSRRDDGGPLRRKNSLPQCLSLPCA